MQETTLKILHPVIPVATGPEGKDIVEVREMRWPDALAFLQALGKEVGQVMTTTGNISFTPDKLPDIIGQSGALIEHLICKATGRDAAWLNTLTTGEMLDLLDAAVELNVSPELFARGKAVADRVKKVFAKENTDAKNPTGEPLTKSTPINAMP
jgi:hypothetical protein